VVLGPLGLGQNILDARSLYHSPDTTAGNNSGSGARREQQNPTATMFAESLVRDCVLPNDNGPHGFLGRIARFADTLGDFLGLPEAAANTTVPIANHNQCAETKAATALNDLGAPIDVHHLFQNFRLLVA
jgi:hypothetical protein